MLQLSEERERQEIHMIIPKVLLTASQTGELRDWLDGVLRPEAESL